MKQKNKCLNHENYFTLQLKLSEFGLTPFEWILIPKGTKELIIQNKKESSFKLHGTFQKDQNSKFKWKEINLLTI